MIKQFEVIVDYDYTKLKEDPNNPNSLTGSDKEAHEKSLDERGQLGIVLIDQNDMIINGTHTWKKCIKEGTIRGPVIKKIYKNDTERRIDRQVLNYGPHGIPDKVKQREEILKIYKNNELDNFVKLMNQSKDQYLALLSTNDNAFPEADDVSIGATPKTKPGQVYVLGTHRVMCGDATEGDDVLKLLESDQPRLIFTDPPFDLKEYDYLRPFFEIEKDLEVLIWMDDKGTKELCQDSRYGKFFIGFYPITFNSPSRFPNQPMMSHRLINHFRKGKSNFQNLRDAFATVHELVLRKDGMVRQEKPLDLPRRFIMHYTRPGEQVLDLFGGSGSTMLACEQLQRNCLTMEKDPLTVDKIIKRYEKMTHLKAELI